MDPKPSSQPSPRGNARLWGVLAAVAMVVMVGMLALGALGFFGFQRVRDRRAAVREATSQLEKAAAEERAKMADLIRSGDVKGGDAALGRIKDELEKTSHRLGSADAAAARAMAGFMGKMQQQVRDYQAAAERFTKAQVFTPTYRDRATLESQREIVREFLKQNEKLADTVRRSDELLRAEMDAAMVPAKTRDSAVAGFNKSQAVIRPLQARIRSCDRELGDAALIVIDLFERHWGKWHREPVMGRMVFDDQTALVGYNALLERMQAAANEQEKAQEELVKVMGAAKRP